MSFLTDSYLLIVRHYPILSLYVKAALEVLRTLYRECFLVLPGFNHQEFLHPILEALLLHCQVESEK